MASGQAQTGELVGYVSDPNGRGTPTLVVSCLLTLVLCVWSALHLNVPHRDQTASQAVLLNTRWITAGIYAPELVVFTAWRQWSSARILSRAVSEAVGNGPDKLRRDSRPVEWSMTHSFFACSGGFAFELQSMRSAVHDCAGDESSRVPRLTLTARGVALLARCGYLPEVEREQIEDKSKANALAKATVVVQATWMLVQVFGRLASRMPVTLLEVNTVAHVLCAFAMYLFWWHKPLLPNAPIIIRDEHLAPLAAFMYSSSEMSGYSRPERVKSQTVVKTFFAYLSLYSKTPEMDDICLRMTGKREDRPTSREPEFARALQPDFSLRRASTLFQRSTGQCADHVKDVRQKEKATAFFERRPQVQHSRPGDYETQNVEERRWSLMLTAFQAYPNLLNDRVLLSHQVHRDECIHLRPEELVADEISNWPSNDLPRSVDGLVVGMVLWLANFCYGGIHAAAWNDFFPSTAEKWFWRASSSYIGFCGGLWVVLNSLVARNAALNEFWERWMDGQKSWLQSFGLGIVVFLCGFSLVVARSFIVLEAFVSIRILPAGAYDTPQWTNIFPHL